jgi:hypothetical protein
MNKFTIKLLKSLGLLAILAILSIVFSFVVGFVVESGEDETVTIITAIIFGIPAFSFIIGTTILSVIIVVLICKEAIQNIFGNKRKE